VRIERLLAGLLTCLISTACAGVDRQGYVVGSISTLDGRTGISCDVRVGRAAAGEYPVPCIDHTTGQTGTGKVETGHSFLCSTMLNTKEDSRVRVWCEGYSSELSEPFRLPASGGNQIDLGDIVVRPPVI
jgi:hypothetical protein